MSVVYKLYKLFFQDKTEIQNIKIDNHIAIKLPDIKI